VSAKFHAAAAKTAIGPTKLLTSRRDPWAVGDRVAWRDEERHGDWPAVVTDVLDRLGPLLELSPPTAPAQVIHGDLGGNVLFADEDGLPPAVIDIAPYYRPAAWADAIVVADAVAWNGAPATLAVGFLARHADGDQLLARAIAFRVAAAAGLWSRFPARVEAEVHAYRALLPLLR
jgi:Ser/Thr protein kinase RdoA (MazF antagonist)